MKQRIVRSKAQTHLHEPLIGRILKWAGMHEIVFVVPDVWQEKRDVRTSTLLNFTTCTEQLSKQSSFKADVYIFGANKFRLVILDMCTVP